MQLEAPGGAQVGKRIRQTRPLAASSRACTVRAPEGACRGAQLQAGLAEPGGGGALQGERRMALLPLAAATEPVLVGGWLMYAMHGMGSCRG